jgi:hypothetical protein
MKGARPQTPQPNPERGSREHGAILSVMDDKGG